MSNAHLDPLLKAADDIIDDNRNLRLNVREQIALARARSTTLVEKVWRLANARAISVSEAARGQRLCSDPLPIRRR